ncbi:MAG TPA: HAMP domain-containing sensor histidine kinase [Candidatus Methanoperedens sp.]|nr:HAMP domain-containing sensor histidine kinase [Candidatus Methanoperedens sp.]
MFKEARLKLTVWYLLIIMVISLSFSGIIFGMVCTEMERFSRSPRFVIENRQSIMEREELLRESKKRLFIFLAEINGVILIISGSLGYFLAGKTLSPIQKMLEEQKRFVSDASHELRTPLTALKSMFEVGLRDKKMNLKEARMLIGDGIEETDKLKKLSDSLLELARENTNGQKMLVEKVSTFAITDEAIKNVSIKAKNKKIKIVNKVRPFFVLGNKDKLTELLVILLDNALKYSPNNSLVKISTKKSKGQIIIKVKDQGQGIEKKDIPYIFERFYRADSARGRIDEGGYGLGLAIAKKIIDEHNGKISVKSVVDQGSEFKIYLPSVSFQKQKINSDHEI